jgi:peptidoglycan hydrolase-like protein with peptidoglycan-binding domain
MKPTVRYSRIFSGLAFTLILAKPLFFGISSPDVITLQKILNSNPQTTVSTSGVGSSGDETSYFGEKTLDAVKRFQTLYRDDILSPANLIAPTGYVGSLTLKKLNDVNSGIAAAPATSDVSADPLLQYEVSPADAIDIYSTDEKIQAIDDSVTSDINTALLAKKSPTINAQNLSQLSASQIFITALSSQGALPGTTITISGNNFTEDNTVYFGTNYKISNLPVSAGTLSFTLPPFPAGRYDIAVQNENGISNTQFFIVEGPNQVPVTISGVSPANAHFGGTITISGSGFLPTGNDVYTSFGIIKDVPSQDGKTLEVKIDQSALQGVAAVGNGTKAEPMNIGVLNNNGYSTESISVNVLI